MFDLGGKTALVTGASGGIGGAIARALEAQGARVALSGTRVEALAAASCTLRCVVLRCWARCLRCCTCSWATLAAAAAACPFTLRAARRRARGPRRRLASPAATRVFPLA